MCTSLLKKLILVMHEITLPSIEKGIFFGEVVAKM